MIPIVYSSDRRVYLLPTIAREGGLWLSVDKHPLPVPIEWHRPGMSFACVFRGRDYWRIALGNGAPVRPLLPEEIEDDSELVADFRDAVWWTPGLQEAWVEIDKLKRSLNVAPKTSPSATPIKDKQELHH